MQKNSKQNHYFTDETQDAILKWQTLDSLEEKNSLFEAEIYPVFQEMIEATMHKYEFTFYAHEKDDMIQDCMAHLLTVALPRYKAKKNTAAFSYFNTVAKNWLLNIKSKERSLPLPLDTVAKMPVTPTGDLISYPSDNLAPDEIEEKKEEIYFLLSEIAKDIDTEDEAIVLAAIKYLIDHYDDLEMITARSPFIYLKQITQLPHARLMAALESIREQYRDIMAEDLFF